MEIWLAHTRSNVQKQAIAIESTVLLHEVDDELKLVLGDFAKYCSTHTTNIGTLAQDLVHLLELRQS